MFEPENKIERLLMRASADPGEQRLLPFFSARSRAKTWFKADRIVAPDTVRIGRAVADGVLNGGCLTPSRSTAANCP